MAPPSPSTLSIAVLLVPPVQLLDIAPVDLFHMLSKTYMRECRLPAPLINRGIDDVKIHYVADISSVEGNGNGVGLSPVNIAASTKATPAVALASLTASARMAVTHDIADAAVQPGTVDIIFVPGPDPSVVPSDKVRVWLRRHAEVESTVIMSVCTGVYVLGHAGLLDDKCVTGPRALVGMELKGMFPGGRWRERRWCVDCDDMEGQGEGKGGIAGGDRRVDVKEDREGATRAGRGRKGRLWTSGGITNGQEMVMAYIRQNYCSELADLVGVMSDVVDRGRDYESTAVGEGVWFGWLIARSWLRGMLGSENWKV